MTTRGLPGFLRRSRLRDDFYTSSEDEDDDEDNDYDFDDGDNSIEDDAKSRNGLEANCNETKKENNEQKNNTSATIQSHASSLLDPSPLAETSAREDVISEWTNIADTTLPSDNTKDNYNNDSQRSLSTLGESEWGKDAVQSHRDVTSGTSRFSSSITNSTNDNISDNQSNNKSSSKRFSMNKSYREIQFEKVLGTDNNNNDDNKNNNTSNSNHVVKMSELRKIAWNGVPPQYRGTCWKILLGYLPTNAMRRQQTLERKRAEYKDAIQQHYYIDDNSRTIQEQETLRQVLVDVPRTAPDIPLFRNEKIKRALSRLLYIWAMRHPASSYVQGINDLATPLFAVFLADDYEGEDVLDGSVMVVLEEERLDEVEADVYWCLTNILAGIQDHYTADQPGVQRMVMRLQELVNRIDGELYNHIHSVGIQFMQFAFKWMNCLLLREFNLKCVVRLWDTYISEESGNGFEDFHVYVCAAFLSQFSSQLQEMDFDELFQFMQQVPTEDWGETEIEMLLSHAYVLSTLFGGSDAHLTSNNNGVVAPAM